MERDCHAVVRQSCLLLKTPFVYFGMQLLEMLMNNIGENIHKQVIDTGILPILVKIVKKKVFTFL